MGCIDKPKYSTFRKFATANEAPVNHQVIKVETITDESADVYCMTVVGHSGEDDRHNFAVNGLTNQQNNDGKLLKSLIFVWNSIDEDYFIPVRGGESGTKIETLAGGQNTAAVEDVAYIQKKLFAALKIPRAYLGYDESLCLLGSNRIPLLDGRILSVEELVKEYAENPNKQNYVYSSDVVDGSIKPGKILNAWKTKEVDHFYRVQLDTGGHIDCTGNHPFLCRDGQYKRADELQLDQSLMPLYRKLSSSKKLGGQDLLDGYEMTLDNSAEEWKYTHKIVNDAVENHLIGKQRVIHHVDFDKRNNNPNNLSEMTWFDHRKLHSQNLEHTLLRPDVIERAKAGVLKWVRSSNHRAFKSKMMQSETTTVGSYHYNRIHSKAHSEKMSDVMRKNWNTASYRTLKSKQNKDLWNNNEYRAKFTGSNHWSRIKNVNFTIDSLIAFCNDNNVKSIKQWRKDHPASISSKCTVGMRFVISLIKRAGFNNWRDFAFQKLLIEVPKRGPDPKNHKVVSVEIIKLDQPVSVYDIEVEKWHNFAVGSDRIIELQKGVSGGNDYVFVHNSSKATLAQEDIRFSRTISVIQKTVIAELNKLAIIHLYANGFDSEDLQNFTLRMSNPSTIAQQQKLELWRSKFEIAGTAPEGQMSKEFIRKEIWGLNDAQCKEIDDQRLKEKFVDQAIESASTAGSGEESDEEVEASDEQGKEEEEPGEEPGEELDLFAGDDVIQKNPYLDLLTAGDDPEDEDIDIKFSLKDVEVPVKAQRQIDRALYNRGRIRHHGASKTHMPDFSKMLKSDNKSYSDPYDKEWISSYVRNPFGEANTRETFKTSIGSDVIASLRNMTMSPKFQKNVKNSTQTSQILSESDNFDDADAREYREVLIIDDDDGSN